MATIVSVLQRAFRDEKFLNELLKNIDHALKSADLALSPEDRKGLEQSLDAKYTVNGREFLILGNKILAGLGGPLGPIPPPPPPWIIFQWTPSRSS